MASIFDVLRKDRPRLEEWAGPLFRSELAPQLLSRDRKPLVWAIKDDASQATITDQFKAGAAEYHARYAASGHFEQLFVQALAATGIEVAKAPLILDLGSGSGVNSIVPCRRLFPGAKMVATDLSGELLAMLAHYLRAESAQGVLCVRMDAMSQHVAPGAFDLVTGASILHHLDIPEKALAAASRALKPGGHAIFFEPFNGWIIMRLAFERILAEARLRGAPLDLEVEGALVQLIADVGERNRLDRALADFQGMDDKWLFSRTRIEKSASDVGFEAVRFVPHNDHASLYRDVAFVHLRLHSGRPDLSLPDWATDILDSFDAAMTLQAKRELMMEGSIVLTKAR